MNFDWANPNDICFMLLCIANIVLLLAGLVVFCWALSGFMRDRLYPAGALGESDERPEPMPRARTAPVH